MEIQPADLTDVQQCRQLDMSYITEYVWQMQTQDNHRSISLRFDTIRLPRPMQVDYPRSPDELLEHWQQPGCFLVAYDLAGEIVGFLDAQPHPWQSRLSVVNFVIDRPQRRRGIATALLQAAEQWALQHGLHQIMLEMQTKNYPAISFAYKQGFLFCGYNELYYSNGDITLFFSRSI